MSIRIRFRLAFVYILVFILFSCNSTPEEKVQPFPTIQVLEVDINLTPTDTPLVLTPSSVENVGSLHPTAQTLEADIDLTPTDPPLVSTPNNIENVGPLRPTAQIPEEAMIAPTVDINAMNINLKHELYFSWGAEGDGATTTTSSCTERLFSTYNVSFESEKEFFTDGTIPPELSNERISPFLSVSLDDELHLCIYNFPEDETITIELYTPENVLCVSQEVRVSDYYYLAIGEITQVDLTITDWRHCSYAGQWSIVAGSESVFVKKFIEIGWHEIAKLSVSGVCDSSEGYVSVLGSGYPHGESRLIGVYGNCFLGGDFRYHKICKLLQSYFVEISDKGSFDVLLPSTLSGEYIVVPVIRNDPPEFAGYLPSSLGLAEADIAHYPENCNYKRYLNPDTPGLDDSVVMDIERKFRELGYPEVVLFDRVNTDAVLLFQQTNGLEASGLVDEATCRALFGKDALPRPHERDLYVTDPWLEGDDVVVVQQRLMDLYYVEVGVVDGYYGPQTETAVVRFQKTNGLSESGIVDEQTWNTIFSNDPIPGR